MLHTLKFLHLFFGTIFLGGLLFSFGFLTYCIFFKNDAQKLLLTLKFSFMVDIFSVILIINQFITGSLMVRETHYTFETPWIDAAYVFLGLSTILILVSFLIKRKNYNLLKSSILSAFQHKTAYLISNFLIIAIIVLIIRDAVLKTTLL